MYKKLSYDFWFKTLRDSKVRAAKDHGKRFRSRLASSFSGIVHYGINGRLLAFRPLHAEFVTSPYRTVLGTLIDYVINS